MIRFITLLGFLTVIFLCACSSNKAMNSTLTVTVISTEGVHNILKEVEIADTPAKHEKGLMDREKLADNSGMLFIYKKPREGSFWMKNTYIPLAIAFIDIDGTIIDILHGKPQDVTLLTPSHPYLTVLEVNDGWFSSRDIFVGSTINWE